MKHIARVAAIAAHPELPNQAVTIALARRTAEKPLPCARINGGIGAKAKPLSGKAFDGTAMTSGVRQIIWSAGNCPAHWSDGFVFQTRVTDTFAVGQIVVIPVVPDRANAAKRRIKASAAGYDPHNLACPPPGRMAIAPVAHQP